MLSIHGITLKRCMDEAKKQERHHRRSISFGERVSSGIDAVKKMTQHDTAEKEKKRTLTV